MADEMNIKVSGVNTTFQGQVKVTGRGGRAPFIRLQTIRDTASPDDSTGQRNHAVYASKEQALEVVRAILTAISQIEGADEE